MFDAPETTLTTPGPVTKTAGDAACPHAAIYHDYISMLQGMANAQRNLIWRNRAEYDYYYDHLEKLPKDVREAAEPEICAIVATIEQGVINIGLAREGVSKAFDDACVSKMGAIAKDLNTPSETLAKRYLETMEDFRSWRITHLDGVNVDMTPLLDQRKNYRPSRSGKSGLFEKLFTAWADEVKPELSVLLTRSVVLDGLAVIAPDLAGSYVASLQPFEANGFGRKGTGTRVLLEEVEFSPCP